MNQESRMLEQTEQLLNGYYVVELVSGGKGQNQH